MLAHCIFQIGNEEYIYPTTHIQKKNFRWEAVVVAPAIELPCVDQHYLRGEESTVNIFLYICSKKPFVVKYPQTIYQIIFAATVVCSHGRSPELASLASPRFSELQFWYDHETTKTWSQLIYRHLYFTKWFGNRFLEMHMKYPSIWSRQTLPADCINTLTAAGDWITPKAFWTDFSFKIFRLTYVITLDPALPLRPSCVQQQSPKWYR